jgi:hypothetical protein
VFPGVTEFGEIPHVGIGAGPATEHARAIVPEKLPCAGNVKTSLTCPPRFTVRLVAAGVRVKSGVRLKVAVTDWSEFIVTLQFLGSVPVQAPLQFANVELPDGDAVSGTEDPGSKSDELQEPPELPQLIPPESPMTFPLPLPARLTLRIVPVTKLAVTPLSESIVNVQSAETAVPAQTPPQLVKIAFPPVSVLFRDVIVPLRNRAEHVPGQLIVEPSIPAGEPVIFPD